MALSKKQVKQLRAMANQLNPLLYIGKNDLTDAAVKQASETMDSHVLYRKSSRNDIEHIRLVRE